MPRPQRSRKVCNEPKFREFVPKAPDLPDVGKDGQNGSREEPEGILLTTDEYEILRLVDLEKKTHGEAAVNMDISRTTATEIYEAAREKVADCIVNGKRLTIQGGNYRICDGSTDYFCIKKCEKRLNYIRQRKEKKK